MFALVKRLVQLLPGFLLIAVVIWVGGPFVVIGDWRPLESESARLLAIVGIVVCWLAWVLVARWRARRASSAMAAALVQQPAAAEPAPPADVVKLRESFEQAADTLSKRGRGATLYDLPWYVFIGAPGSGKTTALLNSGLDFFLEQGGGQARLRGVGGTRNCDWWFTDEAVFLDTAGRFTTQDSDAASDSTGWKEFLALLTTYRKRRPINGVILTISAKDLLTQGDAAREQQVEAARVRLRELGRELQIQLPVYVMVTMCDLVAGFTEYFDDLSQAGRAQVWGVTFPYDLTTNGQAAGTFPVEFDGLVTRLNERVVSRLEEETDTRRRIRLFAFPQQMAAMRDGLAQFVSDVFTGTKYEQQILLRGVYFTSGTQEGTPIDRLIGAVGRGLRMASDAVAAPAGRGKAYFVETLLKDVLIGESGLAGVNRSLEMRKAAGQLALYGGLALVVLFGVMVLSVSYRRNGTYVADVQRDVTRLQAVPPARAASAVTTLLPRLDALRRVVDSANRYNTTSIPLGMRWGLYQGTSLGNAARDAYLLELDASMLPFLAARLRQRVIQYGNEPDKLYEYLKAYLMLESPQRLNKQHLLFLAGLEWTPTAGVSADASASVTRHVQALIDREGELRPVAIDTALVRQACATIREASLGRIMYGWLKQQYASSDAHAIRLDVAAGTGPGALIRRKSGVSLAQPVSGLYSKAAFQEITSKSGDELVEQFAADNWVCERSGDLGDRSRLKADLTNIYQQDYADNWDAVLDDLVVAPEAFGTVAATAQSLGVLTGPTSPIRNVLRLVNDNTQLVEAPKAAEAESAMTSTARAAASRLTDMFRARTGAAPPAATAGALVTARFQHIHQLFAGEPGAAPIDQVLARLRDLEQQFRALGPEVGQRPPGDFLKDPLFRQNLGALQQSAATLPPSIKKWIDVIDSGAGGAVRAGTEAAIGSAFTSGVTEQCVATLPRRYPFDRSGPDLALGEFGRLFAPRGVFDRFVTEQLAGLVDTTQRPWVEKEGGVSVSRSMLARLEEAQRIREIFFGTGGERPDVKFTVTIAGVDAAATRFVLNLDGQLFEDRRVQRAPASWPGDNQGIAAATFEDRTGIPVGVKFEGPWALFRLIDASQPQRESDTRVRLTFRAARGHEATVILDGAAEPLIGRSWQGFECQ